MVEAQAEEKKNKKLYFQVVFLGVIALIGSGIFLFENLGIAFEYDRAKAEVLGTKQIYNRADDTARTYIPTVRYKTKDGNTITVNTGHGSSQYNFSQGEEVTVYYDPKNPRTFKIATFMTMWLGPLIGFSLGLLILLSSRSLKK